MDSAREAVMSIRVGQAKHKLSHAKVVDNLARPERHVKALGATVQIIDTPIVGFEGVGFALNFECPAANATSDATTG